MTTSFTAAAITGLGTAYATAAAFGPVASIGFAIGSCIGYVASVIFYWRTAMTTALTAFDDHPELMYLHLIRNYPTIGFQRVKMDSPEAQAEFRQKLRGNGIESLKLRCFMMSSWHTAAPGIEVCSTCCPCCREKLIDMRAGSSCSQRSQPHLTDQRAGVKALSPRKRFARLVSSTSLHNFVRRSCLPS